MRASVGIVKEDNKCFVARISSKRVQRDIMVRRNWQTIRLLHYEATVGQGLRSDNIYRKQNHKEEETHETLSMEEMVVDNVFGNEED